ncbi:hypothetical protein D3C72_1616320 [compost metagenome]
MKAERWNRTKDARGEVVDFCRAGERCFTPAKMAGELAQVCLLIGSENGQNVSVYTMTFYFAHQRFCPLAQIGTANFTHRFAFPHGFMLHNPKLSAMLR